MLTKGIVLSRILGTNKYNVRIPYLETPGMEPTSFEAIVSNTPGMAESFMPDDVVIVGFEDHMPSKPIILGKLYLKDENVRGSASFDALNIGGSANLPMSTMVGGINVYNLLMKMNRIIGNMETDVSGLSTTVGEQALKQAESSSSSVIVGIPIVDIRS